MKIYTPLFLLLSGVAVGADQPATPQEIKAIERAHVAAEAVRDHFRGSLKAALKKEDIAQALKGCRIDPTVAAPYKVGRTAARLRNPLNAAPEWTKPYLKKFSSGPVGEVPPSVLVPLGHGRLGYLEPIFIEPVCLRCHGQQVSPGVAADLKKFYPRDEAVNYSLGEFRGLLWLEWTDAKDKP